MVRLAEHADSPYASTPCRRGRLEGAARGAKGREGKTTARGGHKSAEDGKGRQVTEEGLVTEDGIDSFAFGTVGSSVGTHEAFQLPGSRFAIEPVGANVITGAAGQ